MWRWCWLSIACGTAEVNASPAEAPEPVGSGEAPPKPILEPTPPEGGDPTVRAAWVRLAGDLAAPRGAPVRFEARDVVGGVQVLRVQHEGAYPGSGVVSTVWWAGRTFGRHGDAPLAELVRALGWLQAPPAMPDLLRVVDAALFEGMSSLHDGTLARERGWTLTATRFGFPDDDERVVLEIGESGPETFSRTRVPRR